MRCIGLLLVADTSKNCTTFDDWVVHVQRPTTHQLDALPISDSNSKKRWITSPGLALGRAVIHRRLAVNFGD